jgi:hypothetical protein
LSREGELDRDLGSSPEGDDGPVTATVTRRVKPGHEPFYERFLEGIIAAAIQFPGHLGVEVFSPETASSDEYRGVTGSTPGSTYKPGLTPMSAPPGWSAPSRTSSARWARRC